MASKRSLKAAAETAPLFTETQEQKPKSTKRVNKIVSELKMQEKKRETITFAARIDGETAKKWGIYSTISGYGDKGKMTEAALTEYMNRHKLAPEEQKKFDTLMGL